MTIEHQLEKARIYAYWSLVGIFIPVVGMATSAISLSILNRIVIEDVDAQEESDRLRSIANVMGIVSIVLTIATIVLTLTGFTMLVQEYTAVQDSFETIQSAQESLESLYN